MTDLTTIKGRANYLAKQMEIITASRGGDYGEREPNMTEFNQVFHALTDKHDVIPQEAPSSNICLFAEKIARWKHKPKLDTAIDALNYLAFWFAEQEEIFESAVAPLELEAVAAPVATSEDWIKHKNNKQ